MADTKARRRQFQSVQSRQFTTSVAPPPVRERKPGRISGILWSGAVFVVGLLLVIGFFYLDRRGQISRLVLSSGGFGIAISVVLMAVFCVIPVPGEFLLILDMKIFGVWWGVLYSWIGTMIGSIGVFLLARYVAHNLLRSFIPDERMAQVNEWVGKRGVVGLLLAHVVPLPFIVVNYAAGIIRSIRLWDFIWTSAVGGVPYYVGAGLVFLGVSTKYLYWSVVGLIALVFIWIGGFLYNRHVNRLKRWLH